MITAARTASQVVVHMTVSFLIMYSFTGSIAFGGLAAILEPICVVGVLPLHDRAWRWVENKLAKREAAGRKGWPACSDSGHALDFGQSS